VYQSLDEASWILAETEKPFSSYAPSVDYGFRGCLQTHLDSSFSDGFDEGIPSRFAAEHQEPVPLKQRTGHGSNLLI